MADKYRITGKIQTECTWVDETGTPRTTVMNSFDVDQIDLNYEGLVAIQQALLQSLNIFGQLGSEAAAKKAAEKVKV